MAHYYTDDGTLVVDMTFGLTEADLAAMEEYASRERDEDGEEIP